MDVLEVLAELEKARKAGARIQIGPGVFRIVRVRPDGKVVLGLKGLATPGREGGPGPSKRNLALAAEVYQALLDEVGVDWWLQGGLET